MFNNVNVQKVYIVLDMVVIQIDCYCCLIKWWWEKDYKR